MINRDEREGDTIEALRSSEIATPHGFFTRNGGVSEGPYSTLNCGLASGDRPEAVIENRARAVRAIGGDPARLVSVRQVHGHAAVHVSRAWTTDKAPQADAMVTNTPGLVLAVVTADCAPVLFVDSQAGVIGAAHAGWRGAVAGVLESTLGAMISLGATGERVSAAIGPCIHVASYEVGRDLRDVVLDHSAADKSYFSVGSRAEHWQFDLRGYCRARLERAGLTRVYDVHGDTFSSEALFFSHRRRVQKGGGPLGHQVSLIRLG